MTDPIEMTEAQTRSAELLKDSNEAHRIIMEACDWLDGHSYALGRVGLNVIADDINRLVSDIRDANKRIQGNRAESLNLSLKDAQCFHTEIFKALLDNVSGDAP